MASDRLRDGGPCDLPIMKVWLVVLNLPTKIRPPRRSRCLPPSAAADSRSSYRGILWRSAGAAFRRDGNATIVPRLPGVDVGHHRWFLAGDCTAREVTRRWGGSGSWWSGHRRFRRCFRQPWCRHKNEDEWLVWPPTVTFASVRLYVKHEMCSQFRNSYFNSSVSALLHYRLLGLASNNKDKPWHHLNKKVQRRLLSSSAPCRSANP